MMKTKLFTMILTGCFVMGSMSASAAVIKAEHARQSNGDMRKYIETTYNEKGLMENQDVSYEYKDDTENYTISYEYDDKGNPTEAQMEITVNGERQQMELKLENEYQEEVLARATGHLFDEQGEEYTADGELPENFYAYLELFQDSLMHFTGYDNSMVSFEGFQDSFIKENGNLQVETLASGPNYVTTITYDEQQRMVEQSRVIKDDTTVISQTYDDTGCVSDVFTDKTGVSTEYTPTYEMTTDENGNTVYKDADASMQFSFDTEGRTVMHKDKIQSTAFTYDAEGRVASTEERYLNVDYVLITEYEYF